MLKCPAGSVVRRHVSTISSSLDSVFAVSLFGGLILNYCCQGFMCIDQHNNASTWTAWLLVLTQACSPSGGTSSRNSTATSTCTVYCLGCATHMRLTPCGWT